MNERNGSKPHRAAIFFSGAALAVLLSPGCEKNERDTAHQAKAPAPPAILRVAVVDDPALAESLRKVRGEWHAQSGSELEVQEQATSAVVDAKKLDADAIVYPSGLLGPLAERRLIRPLNPSWLASDPLETADLLIAHDSPELSWDGQPYSVPLGEPVIVLAYRSDLFERFGKPPPRTWEEYQSLAEFFGDRAKLLAAAKQGGAKEQPLDLPADWSGTLEPLAGNWAARILLARAAAYAKHRDYFSVLFDRETMKPLIAGPLFVKALTELAAISKSAHVHFNKLTPPDTIYLFLSGHAAMAIGWPKAAPMQSDNQAAKTLGAGAAAFAELPGARAAYNLGHQAWENRGADEQQQVTLRGIEGRVGSVVRGSDHAEAAFGLLAWIAGKRWSSEILSVSPATAIFRQSQLEEPLAWTGKQLDVAAGKQYGETLKAALARRETLLMPRIPGQSEYLAALDDAVAAAVSGKKTPQAALDEAAAQWRQITSRLGRDSQLEAYRRSLKEVR